MRRRVVEPFLLSHLLSQSAERWPERPAVVLGDQVISYLELDRVTDVLAQALRDEGLRRGERVGILLGKSLTAIIAVAGILKAGGVYVPMDVGIPALRFAYVAENCGLAMLVTTGDLLARVRLGPDSTPSIRTIILADGAALPIGAGANQRTIAWDDLIGRAHQSAAGPEGIERDLAYVLYTSGSTGRPKGVMFTHRNALAFVNTACGFLGIHEDDRLASHAPLHFDLSIFDIFVAFKAGAAVVLVPEKIALFPAAMARYIGDARISVWNSVPSALVQLATRVTLADHDLSCLRLVLFSGEVFPARHLRTLMVRLPRAEFYNLYGQTEANTSMYYHVGSPPSDDAWRAPIGRPLPNFDVFALDEHERRIAREGEEGELQVRGASVAQGYWGDRERTAKSFVDNCLQEHFSERTYRTGDLVALDAQGEYVFRGRKDQLIKSRGYRIELDEIEAVLRGHPAIAEAAVVPVRDEEIGNRILAFVVPAKDARFDLRECQQYLGERLPRYMLPESIEERDSLPLTSTAKVDRQRLIESAAGRRVE